MERELSALARRYRTDLRRYLRGASAANLRTAPGLGRQAMALGLETLELALIHEQALVAEVLPLGTDSARDRAIERAKMFFAQAITPLEETHRAALEANVRLVRLNRSLIHRTADLASSNRKLKSEIVRRKVAEQTLRTSERRAGHLLDQSQRMQEQLRQLSRRILSAQEEERKRISRELHDVIAQLLTSINLRLAALKTEATVDTEGLTKNIARTQRLLEKSVDVVHQFAYSLRPAALDHLGLIPTLHAFMTAFTKETGIRVSLTAFAGVNQLDGAKRTVLYRVAQEALTNVSRHAQATRVETTIQRLPKAVLMRITDNGKSFDVNRTMHTGKGERMGLLGMRERVEMVGGAFSVESAPGKGTIVQAQIPLAPVTQETARP